MLNRLIGSHICCSAGAFFSFFFGRSFFSWFCLGCWFFCRLFLSYGLFGYWFFCRLFLSYRLFCFCFCLFCSSGFCFCLGFLFCGLFLFRFFCFSSSFLFCLLSEFLFFKIGRASCRGRVYVSLCCVALS